MSTAEQRTVTDDDPQLQSSSVPVCSRISEQEPCDSSPLTLLLSFVVIFIYVAFIEAASPSRRNENAQSEVKSERRQHPNCEAAASSQRTKIYLYKRSKTS